jgi:hypothetical protein
MRLYVDGKRVAEGETKSLIPNDPAQQLEVGSDAGSAVGSYNSPNTLTGIVDEPRLYFAALGDQQIARRYSDGGELSDTAALAVSFDDGSARDHSLNRNHGTVENARLVQGKSGMALQFTPTGGGSQPNQGNSLVKPKWTQDVPIYVRGMVLSGYKLFIVGPPDIIDEEATFKGLSESDPQVQQLLADQDAVLEGERGGQLLVVNTLNGETEYQLELESLPAGWPGPTDGCSCQHSTARS